MEDNETVLGLNKFEKALIIVVPMILGAVIGWFVPVIAGWVLKLPIVPMEKLIITISSLNHFWVSIVATIIGVIVGLVFSIIVFSETLKVIVSDNKLKLVIDDVEKVIEKKEVSAIYLENKYLVVLGQSGHELYRGLLESKLEVIQEAFSHHSYPWKEEDPFASQYKRWVLDHPDFPADINALLNARARALKEENKEEAKHLREDLAKVGVVIRDEKKAQYVRMINDANNSTTQRSI